MGEVVLLKLFSAKLTRLTTVGVEVCTQSAVKSLQVVFSGLPVSRSTKGTIQSALAEGRLAGSGDSRKPTRSRPVICQSSREVVRKSCSGAVANSRVMVSILRVPYTDEVGTELLTIFDGNKPPGLVAANRTARRRRHIAAGEMSDHGRERAMIGSRERLECRVAFEESKAAMKAVAALLRNHVDYG